MDSGPVFFTTSRHFRETPGHALKPGLLFHVLQAINGVIALQCIGIEDFYWGWMVEVFVIPSSLLGLIALYYIYQRGMLDEDLAMADFTDR